MRFDDMRVSHKLWGAILGLVLVMMAALFFMQQRANTAMVQVLRDVALHEEMITLATRWEGLTEVVVERIAATITIENPEVTNALSQRSAANSAKVNETQARIRELATSEQDKQMLEKIGHARTATLALFKKIPEIKANGNMETVVRFSNEQFLPAAERYVGTLREFVQLQKTQRDTRLQQAEEARQHSTWLGVGVAALVLLVAVLLSWALVRSITAPLHQVVQVAQTIGAGDLTQTIQTQRQDEFGDLMRAFTQMSERLRSLVAEVRAGVNSVSSAAGQIANGNHDLSARTEQTAANLQQTAASMEQLTATVTQSVDTARQANQLASMAAQSAQRGGEVVNQVVSSMQQITDSSRKIADIIGVIDGIAFQTNILALNAAVEAARAGEQGRGFAVVASEVRSLAGRSAEAAKEIKALIDTSVANVEAGSQQVAQAGQSMGQIVSGVQRVSDLIGEITASSTEQRDGIAQVNVAVTNLDQMTQQNAALVEESAAAASAMRDQAQRLSDVVSVFNVGASLAASTANTSSAPRRPTSPPPPIRAKAVPAPTARATAQPAVATPARPSAPPKAAPARIAAPAPALAHRSTTGADDDWESF
ncbi:MAG: HAMP domain-containing protein [Burkholderiaceae bacterium]|nr:HAMP domain-containing protein [Burkholderiaceae bacterium]